MRAIERQNSTGERKATLLRPQVRAWTRSLVALPGIKALRQGRSSNPFSALIPLARGILSFKEHFHPNRTKIPYSRPSVGPKVRQNVPLWAYAPSLSIDLKYPPDARRDKRCESRVRDQEENELLAKRS